MTCFFNRFRADRSARTILAWSLSAWLIMLSAGVGTPARADRVVLNDGRIFSNVTLDWQEGLRLRRMDGPDLSLQWGDLERVDYAFPVDEGEFTEKWQVYHEAFSRLPLEEALREGWLAVLAEDCRLPERDENNFFENRPPDRLVPPLPDALLPEFEQRVEECFQEGRLREMAELAAILMQAGYRSLHSPLPERVQSGRRAMDAGFAVFSRILQAKENPDERDWNIIFLTNRFYESWRSAGPRAAYFNPALYRKHLEQQIDFSPDESGSSAENFRTLAEAYIRQADHWIHLTELPEVRNLLADRQERLAEAWVRSIRPGLTAETLSGRDAFETDWKVIRAKMEISYLTAESLLFKRNPRRLDPRTQTNIPPLTDPFSGRPYRYNRGEFIDQVYSIGPDRQDHQGAVLYQPEIGQLSGDIFLLNPN